MIGESALSEDNRTALAVVAADAAFRGSDKLRLGMSALSATTLIYRHLSELVEHGSCSEERHEADESDADYPSDSSIAV